MNEETKAPTNTTNEVREDPGSALVELAGKSVEGFVTGQERQGQQEMVSSTVLPTDLGTENAGSRFHRPPEENRKTYEDLGFVFGNVVEDDPIFQHVRLPEGWSRIGTDHSMWSEIVDAEGFVRVQVFYKAAFYDRSSHCHLTEPPFYTPEQKTAENRVYDELCRGQWRSWVTDWKTCRRDGEAWVVVFKRRAERDGRDVYGEYDDALVVTIARDGTELSRETFPLDKLGTE